MKILRKYFGKLEELRINCGINFGEFQRNRRNSTKFRKDMREIFQFVENKCKFFVWTTEILNKIRKNFKCLNIIDIAKF